jgi:hypothetical protein
MGNTDLDRSRVIEPNTTDKVMGTRTDAIDPTIRKSDRTTTGNNADVIVVEPRDNKKIN